jgi:SAM-dependent methyltransferase
MSLSEPLKEKVERDRRVWNECAGTYEERIVCGHPDVLAYESFEEDLLDRMLAFLAREQDSSLALFDVGCGSGRLHLRYGLKATRTDALPEADVPRVASERAGWAAYAYDPLLAAKLDCVGGLDFSSEMLALAGKKLRDAGLGSLLGSRLRLDRGSAFDLSPMVGPVVPVVVCVCNSIGVMQGPEGAEKLFASIERAVGSVGGIGFISAYRKEAVGSFALGNYESTMDVCGQPKWLTPDTFAGVQYRKVPKGYKRAHDPSDVVEVDVFDQEGKRVAESHRLVRNPDLVRTTTETGHIQTHSDYESRWYSFAQFEHWISSCWGGHKAWHLLGAELDVMRGEPAQIAILDPRERLTGLFHRWLRARKTIG